MNATNQEIRYLHPLAWVIALLVVLAPLRADAEVFSVTVGGEVYSSYNRQHSHSHFGYLSAGIHARFSRFYMDLDTPMVFVLADGIVGGIDYIFSSRSQPRFHLLEGINGDLDPIPYFRAMSLRTGGTPWRTETERLDVGIQSSLFTADRPIHDDHLGFYGAALGPAVGLAYEERNWLLRATAFAGTSFSNYGKWQPHAGVDLVWTRILKGRIGLYSRFDLRRQRMDFRSYESPRFPAPPPDPTPYQVVDAATFVSLQFGLLILISDPL